MERYQALDYNWQYFDDCLDKFGMWFDEYDPLVSENHGWKKCLDTIYARHVINLSMSSETH